MPERRQSSAFYAGFLLIAATVYGGLALSWTGGGTPGRADGVQWVAGWMSTDVVAYIWAAGAAVIAVGGVLGLVRPCRYRGMVLVSGVTSVAVPLLLGAIFVGSWIVWMLDDPSDPVPPVGARHWQDLGSPKGWVTAVSYWGFAAFAAWNLFYETSVVPLVARVVRVARGKDPDE